MAKWWSIFAISARIDCSWYFACWRSAYELPQLAKSEAHSASKKSIFLRLAGLV